MNQVEPKSDILGGFIAGPQVRSARRRFPISFALRHPLHNKQPTRARDGLRHCTVKVEGGGKRGVISIAGQMAPSSTREETLAARRSGRERGAHIYGETASGLRDKNDLPPAPAPPLANRPDRVARGEQGGPPSLGKK